MFLHVLEKIKPFLENIWLRLMFPKTPNIIGDRDIEHSWVAANIPEGPGKALDFGCGDSWTGLLAVRKGFEVLCLDLQTVTWYYKHPRLKYLKEDLFELDIPQNTFDLIINNSTIEHVGLVGRYGVLKERPDGDLEAMTILKNLLKPGKLMLLTLPIGKDAIVHPVHRVYGEIRLPELLKGWEIIKKEYWTKDEHNCWILTNENDALRKKPSQYCYGLGLFVLIRPFDET